MAIDGGRELCSSVRLGRKNLMSKSVVDDEVKVIVVMKWKEIAWKDVLGAN